MTTLSKDMRDLLQIFERNKVKYALVGGYAVNYYGYVRATQDIDLLVYPSKENARRVMTSLTEFGFGAAGIPGDLFEKEGSAVHLGVEPNRIDLITQLKGVTNRQIFSDAERITIDSMTVSIISLRDLVEAKQKSDRLKDLADAEELLRAHDPRGE